MIDSFSSLDTLLLLHGLFYQLLLTKLEVKSHFYFNKLQMFGFIINEVILAEVVLVLWSTR